MCAVNGTGGVACWGGNDTGQLGDGSTTDRLTPVEVRDSDGNRLLVRSAVVLQRNDPLMLGIAVVVGVLMILSGSWYVIGRGRSSARRVR